MKSGWGRVAGVLLLSPLLGMARATQPDVAPLQIFPLDNPWNWDISHHNVHPNSAAYIASIGSGVSLRADFSFEVNVVSGGSPMTINFSGGFTTETDLGPTPGGPSSFPTANPTGQYNFPASPRVEGGSDAHCISVDLTNHLLYETYQMNTSTSPYSATCGAIWSLDSNQLRPDGWTSADAAGLPIFPGLLRYDEIAQAGPITHAFRVTVPNSQNAHLYPARHDAGTANAAYPPMGLRLRLKASTDLSGYSGTPRKVMDALKTYGLFVADNTGPSGAWYISTTVDSRWGPDIPYVNDPTAGLLALHGSDMEAVQTVDASGNPIPPGSVPPPGGGGGGSGGGGGGGGCGWTGLEPILLLAALGAISRGAQQERSGKA